MRDLTSEDFLAQAISATDPEVFAQEIFDWLGTVCRLDNLAVVAFVGHNKPEVLATRAINGSVFDRIDSHYVNGAYALDPFYRLHKESQAEGVYRLMDIAPDQFQRNEYFKSYYARTTLIDEVAVFIRKKDDVSITVCIGRDSTTGARFSEKDLSQIRQIAPIVRALVARHWEPLDARGKKTSEITFETLQDRLLMEKSIGLSRRQSEVAFLVLQGHSSISIGLLLGISPQTVKVLRKQLYKKCRISSQGELYYLIAPLLFR